MLPAASLGAADVPCKPLGKRLRIFDLLSCNWIGDFITFSFFFSFSRQHWWFFSDIVEAMGKWAQKNPHTVKFESVLVRRTNVRFGFVLLFFYSMLGGLYDVNVIPTRSWKVLSGFVPTINSYCTIHSVYPLYSHSPASLVSTPVQLHYEICPCWSWWFLTRDGLFFNPWGIWPYLEMILMAMIGDDSVLHSEWVEAGYTAE